MRDIVVKNLCKSFGEKAVLRDFSCVFPAGEITCVMGGSGCGKTTLLRVMMGLETPDSGEVAGLPARIGCVFQEDRLLEDFSAIRNVRLVCGSDITDEAIAQELALLGLSESLRQPVRLLSGGMRRRVALVRAVMYRPELMLLDEAFKGLDSATKAIAIDYMLKKRRGATVISVTHDPSEAKATGGRIISMEV